MHSDELGLNTLVLLCKPPLDKITPVISLAMVLSRFCQHILLVTTTCSVSLRRKLEALGVELIETSKKSTESRTLKSRISNWWSFKKTAWDVLNKVGSEKLLWIASGDTALALGRILARYKYILQLHELYDTMLFYRWLLGYYVRHATAIVVPEFCRAAIIRCWYKLPQTPFVLPNKPHYHPRLRNLPVSDPIARRVLDGLKHTKIVLYQGDIHPLRDIRPIAKAVYRLGGDWHFMMMGKDNYCFVEKVKSVNPKASYIPAIPAPYHLEVTSHAYIGVAVYGFDMLNAIFCAPNKIWEYAGFGIPMICLDIPGLRYTVQLAAAGECCNMSDDADIISLISKIDANYDKYRQNALRLFDSVELESIIFEIISQVMSS